MTKRNTYLIVAIIGGVLLSTTGCSKANQFEQPAATLPSKVEAHLSAFANRVRKVPQLPIDEAQDVTGKSRKITRKNILFLSPVNVVAIRQYQSIWPQLKNRPAVIWVQTTPALAQQEWEAAGFKTNPLPSPQTLYTSQSLPTPDAYRATQSGFIELPGMLKKNEVSNWQTFFNEK